MFDEYVYVRREYDPAPSLDGSPPGSSILSAYAIKREKISHLTANDPDALCVFHRDTRAELHAGDPCAECQRPLAAILYRYQHSESLRIYLIAGELAITNPYLDIGEMLAAQVETDVPAPPRPPKPPRKRKPRAHAEAESVAVEVATDALPAEVGGY